MPRKEVDSVTSEAPGKRAAMGIVVNAWMHTINVSNLDRREARRPHGISVVEREIEGEVRVGYAECFWVATGRRARFGAKGHLRVVRY